MKKCLIFSTFSVSFDFKETNFPNFFLHTHSIVMFKSKNIPNENVMKTGSRVFKQFKLEGKKNIKASN